MITDNNKDIKQINDPPTTDNTNTTITTNTNTSTDENNNNNKTTKQAEITQNMSHSELIKSLMKNTDNIRNVCVLAHVDHGKTSLVDSLISYNNIINPRLAGQIRYMDSRPDEQERCITMKSSSIAVAYNSEKFNDNYLINLIDSPGHIDFSSEIYTALKVCDGSIIVIDVVEGICSQTISVIKHAWNEKIKSVLVLNKIDRLINEVCLSPIEAYFHLYRVLESVNSLVSSLIVRDINLSKEKKQKKNNSNNEEQNNDDDENSDEENKEINIDDLIEETENEVYFSPEKGNVLFCSALDGWGFTIESFCEILSTKLGFKKEILLKLLWGEYYFHSKTKKVFTKPITSKSKPMFVEFVLENIYKLYNMITIEKDKEKIIKAATNLKIELNKQEINYLNTDPKNVLRTFMRQWLPIPSTSFDVIISKLPSPVKNIQNKISNVFPEEKVKREEYDTINYIHNNKNINADKLKELDNICYISKVVTLPIKHIGGLKLKDSGEKEFLFMPFARNYAGTLRKGQEYFVIGPKHDPKNKNYDIHKVKFSNLYYFMGQYLEPVDEVPPGCVFSVTGLESFIYKTGTISSVFNFPSIIPYNITNNSLVKVSISTEEHKYMNQLLQGLKIINKSDPAIDYYIQSNGEHILVTSGEVHLERIITDIEELIGKVKIIISPPIVNFKESLANYSYNPNQLIKTKNKKVKNIENLNKKEQRKQDRNELYQLSSGDEDDDKEDLLSKDNVKSCSMPVILKKEKLDKTKKLKNEVKDYKEKKQKTNFFIKKNMHIDDNAKDNNIDDKQDNNIKVKEQLKKRGYADISTPNKVCDFGISAIGMSQNIIDFITNNELLLKKIDNNNISNLPNDLYNQMCIFKDDLLKEIDNKFIKELVMKNLLSFNFNNKCFLFLRKMNPKLSFFNRMNSSTNNEISRKLSYEDNIINNEDYLEKELNSNLRNEITVKEFYSSMKSGFEMAVNNGPLCEEEMYGLFIIIESVGIKKVKESNKDEIKIEVKDNDKDKENDCEINSVLEKVQKEEEVVNTKMDNNNNINNIDDKNEILSNRNSNINSNNNNNNSNLIDVNKNTNNNNTNNNNNNSISAKTNTKSKSKKDTITNTNTNNENNGNTKNNNLTISSKEYYQYGPFLGQILGTIKEGIKLAFLNGDPRLYEAVYLSTFQIKFETIGKVHSVLSKRRGKIIDESPNDEGIISTIEATVPVTESFGFVTEIRKKSSGLANPMLEFYKWEMIDIDPFYIPKTKEEIEEFGLNIDQPNIAKDYINKVRTRKGLPTDDLLVKSSTKQRTLGNNK